MKKLIFASLALLVAGHLHAAPVTFGHEMNFLSPGSHGAHITSKGFTYTHDLNGEVDFGTHEVLEASLALTVWDGTNVVDLLDLNFGKFYDEREFMRYAFDGEGWVTVYEEIDYERFVLGVDVALLNIDGQLDVSLEAWNSANSADFYLKNSVLSGVAMAREVPEPATIGLLGAGLLGLSAARRRAKAA